MTDDAVEELLAKIEALPVVPLANETNDKVHKLDNELHVRDFNKVRRGDKE